METAWDVYAKLLWEKGYGYPLWSPEPHEKGEVDIGDVGFIWEGRFYCLLNASQPSDADVNQRWGDLGPFNFRPFRIDPTYQLDDPRRICTRMLSSSSITTFEVSSKAYTNAGGLGMHLRCTDDRAALLFLPSGAAHGRSYISKGIKDYIRQNEGEWYRIVAEHTQLDIKQGDLMFVTGWIKTSDYFLAACTHGAHVGSISLDAGIGGKAGISVTISGSKDVAPGWEQRTSLRSHNEDMKQSNASGSDERQSDRDTNDQCIFIQYYKTKRRGILASLLPKLKANAEFRDPDDPSRDNGGADGCTAFKCDESSSDGRATGASTPYGRIPSTKDIDPVDDILDYILSNCNATIAIASTEDAQSLCRQNIGCAFSMKAILDETRPPLRVDHSGLGYLSLNRDRGSKGSKASVRSSALHESERPPRSLVSIISSRALKSQSASSSIPSTNSTLVASDNESPAAWDTATDLWKNDEVSEVRRQSKYEDAQPESENDIRFEPSPESVQQPAHEWRDGFSMPKPLGIGGTIGSFLTRARSASRSGNVLGSERTPKVVRYLRYSASNPPCHFDVRHDTSSLRFRDLSQIPNSWDLSRFACEPPQQKMRLYSAYYPWYIDAKSANPSGVTLSELVVAISRSMMTLVSHADYWNDKISDAAREQIAQAHAARAPHETESQKGIRRVDFLMDRVIFRGLARGRDGMWEMKLKMRTL